MTDLLSTKEVAKFLDINEKMVYSLISDKGLPATKVTGKWIFPKHLVEQWIETNTINYPQPVHQLPPYHGIMIMAGSNDPLLERAISLFNRTHRGRHLATFGNLGSMGGIEALRKNLCHVATSHLLQPDDDEYNFGFVASEFEQTPAVVNFCKREQGILVQKGNPKNIQSVADLIGEGIRIVNRPVGTGTRLLFDKELDGAGINPDDIDGYTVEIARHMDVGIEVFAGRADAAPCIRPIAGLLSLDFLPIRWERYDLLISKGRFFDEGIQSFLTMLHEAPFLDIVGQFDGYDLSVSGKMIFPKAGGTDTATD